MSDEQKREIIAQMLRGMMPNDQFSALRKMASGVEPEQALGRSMALGRSGEPLRGRSYPLGRSGEAAAARSFALGQSGRATTGQSFALGRSGEAPAGRSFAKGRSFTPDMEKSIGRSEMLGRSESARERYLRGSEPSWLQKVRWFNHGR